MILAFIEAMENDGEDMDSNIIIENAKEDLPDKAREWVKSAEAWIVERDGEGRRYSDKC